MDVAAGVSLLLIKNNPKKTRLKYKGTKAQRPGFAFSPLPSSILDPPLFFFQSNIYTVNVTLQPSLTPVKRTNSVNGTR